MFDFAWSEIALVGVVALVAIGPKDLPVAIKAVAEMVKKARRMAGEFQTHVDEMVREANLSEVRDQFNDLRRMDIKGKILNAVDSDHTLRKTIADNPFDVKPAPPPVPVHDAIAADPAAAPAQIAADLTSVPGLTETTVEALPEHSIAAPIDPIGDAPPAFTPPALTPPTYIPPAFIPPAIAAEGPPAPKALPPAFVPPAVVAELVSRSSYAPYT